MIACPAHRRSLTHHPAPGQVPLVEGADFQQFLSRVRRRCQHGSNWPELACLGVTHPATTQGCRGEAGGGALVVVPEYPLWPSRRFQLAEGGSVRLQADDGSAVDSIEGLLEVDSNPNPDPKPDPNPNPNPNPDPDPNPNPYPNPNPT